jgi:hypothetical protein
MISGKDLFAFLGQFAGRLENGLGLHLGDFRVRDAEPAAAVAEHGVELRERFDALEQGLDLRDFFRVAILGFEHGQLDHEVLAVGKELMKRRIDRPDGHRVAVHFLEEFVEILFLEGFKFGERLPPRLFGFGQDHLPHDGQAVGPKNMCSVRARPIPWAPKAKAVRVSSGVSALARTLRRRTLSAQLSSL